MPLDRVLSTVKFNDRLIKNTLLTDLIWSLVISFCCLLVLELTGIENFNKLQLC